MITLLRCSCGRMPETGTAAHSGAEYDTGCACGKAGASSWSAHLSRVSWNRIRRAENRADDARNKRAETVYRHGAVAAEVARRRIEMGLA